MHLFTKQRLRQYGMYHTYINNWKTTNKMQIQLFNTYSGMEDGSAIFYAFPQPLKYKNSPPLAKLA